MPVIGLREFEFIMNEDLFAVVNVEIGFPMFRIVAVDRGSVIVLLEIGFPSILILTDWILDEIELPAGLIRVSFKISIFLLVRGDVEADVVVVIDDVL